MSRRGIIGLAGGVAAGAVAAGAAARAGVSTAQTEPAREPSARAPEVRPEAVPAGRAVAHRVYLGSYTSSGGGGIGSATADPTTGKLAVASWAKAVPDPSWLALSADAATLYAVSELVPGGKVSALRPDAQGRPTLLDGQRTGSGPAHVCVHPGGRYLFTSLYDGGGVVTHPIAADGSVGAATDTRRHTPDPGQSASHAHQVVVDPTGGWILAVDLGVDSVYVYTLDPAKGRLKQASRVRVRSGAGPRHLVFHPNGNNAYIAGETDSTVTVCGWQAGTLTPGAVVSTRLKPSTGTNNPAEIAVSADGRFAYVSNRGDNTVAVFAIGGAGSTLKLLATPPCGGTEPRHLAIDPTGRWLYVANQGSGQVVWFPLDPATGLPGKEAGRVAAKAVTQILFG
jgi:6-phosphogluconolactonase